MNSKTKSTLFPLLTLILVLGVTFVMYQVIQKDKGETLLAENTNNKVELSAEDIAKIEEDRIRYGRMPQLDYMSQHNKLKVEGRLPLRPLPYKEEMARNEEGELEELHNLIGDVTIQGEKEVLEMTVDIARENSENVKTKAPTKNKKDTQEEDDIDDEEGE